MIIIVINNNLFLFWRKWKCKYDQMRLTWQGKEWGTKKWKKNEGILTFKRDSSSGWPSLEVEGAAGLVSSPRSLSFLHMSPGSVYLVTCSEGIQNHSSDIKKCRFVFMSGTRGKNSNIFLYLCFFFLHLAARGNHTCKRWSRAGDIFGLPSQSNKWKNDWFIKWMNKCTNSSMVV